MVYLKCLSHIWRRCVVAVFVVISAAGLSQASFAQYPGSAGDFSDSGLSADHNKNRNNTVPPDVRQAFQINHIIFHSRSP